MKRHLVIFSAIVSTIASQAAMALDAPQAENILEFVSSSETNQLTILQTPDAGNSAVISVFGEGNGLAGSSSPNTPLMPEWNLSDLLPGRLTQDGSGHSLSLTVEGSNNMMSMYQSGSGHTIDGTITGSSNIAIIAQIGTGHIAGFNQTGSGNSLMIRQSSW